MLKNLTMNSQQYCTFMSFPFKLHQMLSEAEKDGKESIVSWLPNGEAFKVHKKDKFVDEIMPIYFRQTKFKSFQRQLNLWGFGRIKIGTNDVKVKDAIFHKHFIRGSPQLCNLMTRIKVKGEGPPSAEAVLASRKLMASPESLPKPVSPSPQQSVVDLSALQMPGALSLLLGGRAEQLVASPEASSIAGLGRLDANTSASTKQPASVTAQSAAANMNNALKALACGASSMVHPTSSSQLEEIRLQQERDLKIQQFLCLQSQARNRELLMGLLNQVS